MRSSRILPALLALSLVALPHPARAAYNALEEIPVESPVYKWVEDLATSDPVVHRLRRELEPEGGIRGGLEPMVQIDDEDASLEMSPYVRLGYAEDRARGLVARDDRVGAQVSAASTPRSARRRSRCAPATRGCAGGPASRARSRSRTPRPRSTSSR